MNKCKLSVPSDKNKYFSREPKETSHTKNSNLRQPANDYRLFAQHDNQLLEITPWQVGRARRKLGALSDIFGLG